MALKTLKRQSQLAMKFGPAVRILRLQLCFPALLSICLPQSIGVVLRQILLAVAKRQQWQTQYLINTILSEVRICRWNSNVLSSSQPNSRAEDGFYQTKGQLSTGDRLVLKGHPNFCGEQSGIMDKMNFLQLIQAQVFKFGPLLLSQGIYVGCFLIISHPPSLVLGRSPGEGNGNPLWYSCLENTMDAQPPLVGYSPWSRKESDNPQYLAVLWLDSLPDVV